MSSYKGKAKSLEWGYTYYRRLGENYPLAFRYYTSTFYRIVGQTSRYSIDVSAILAQAQAEYSKERALLSEKFGVNIDFQFDGANSNFKEIIDALNACLNLKDVYQRNVQLIKNSDEIKSVISYYPTYLSQAFSAPDLLNKFWNTVIYGFRSLNLSQIDAAKRAIDMHMEAFCIRGIELMLKGPEVEAAGIDPKLKSAYESLLGAIGSVKTEGSIANQIYNAYGLENLKNIIVESISGSWGKKNLARQTKKAIKTGITRASQASGSGLTQEAIENGILNAVLAAFPQAMVYHSGDTGIKADNIATISIDPNLIASALDEAKGNRQSNIAAFTRLGEKLSGLDDGFIIYSSDKNYLLNANFDGFSVGSTGRNAADFLNSLRSFENNVDTLIGALQQLGSGAIGDDSKGVFENMIAQNIAYMLFDDFSTIGVKTPGGKAIHVMNLNGVMVPMSVILYQLAMAIQQAAADAMSGNADFVKVTIKAPSILFKTDKEQFDQYPGDSAGAWNAQKNYALANTHISARFFKNFRDFVMQYL